MLLAQQKAYQSGRCQILCKGPCATDMDGKPTLVSHRSAADFLVRSSEFLYRHPALNHNILQIAQVLQHPNEYYAPPHWFGSLENRGDVLGVGIYADPDGLVLSMMPKGTVQYLLRSLHESIPQVRRIIGHPACVLEAAAWLDKNSGTKMRESTTWVIGRLDNVSKPRPMATGRLRKAEHSDATLAKSWGSIYGTERPSFLDIGSFYERKVRSGDLYLWEDGEPKVAITLSGASPNGVRISSVFTEPKHRHSGYASTAVATMCSNLLAAGHGFVVLTWRRDDSTVAFYQRLGFCAVGIHQSLTCFADESS